MKNEFYISAVYKWSKDSSAINVSESDIKAISGCIKKDFSNNKNGKVLFKDNNSLRMSIESDVKDYFNMVYEKLESVDAIEYIDNE
jgi:hypothetical protein